MNKCLLALDGFRCFRAYLIPANALMDAAPDLPGVCRIHRLFLADLLSGITLFRSGNRSNGCTKPMSDMRV